MKFEIITIIILFIITILIFASIKMLLLVLIGKMQIQLRLIKRKCDDCSALFEGACEVPNSDPNCVGCKRFVRRLMIRESNERRYEK